MKRRKRIWPRLALWLSPALSFLILYSVLGHLFNRVEGLKAQNSFKVAVTVPAKEGGEEKEVKPPETTPALKPKPAEQENPRQAEAPGKKLTARTGVNPFGADVPAINIYYNQSEIRAYMQALASRGCVFLVRSAMDRIFAEYDPIGNSVSTTLPNLRSFSPRSRVIAVYGENMATDQIITQAVEVSNRVFIPDGAKLIALLSQEWENRLLEAIGEVAGAIALETRNIESAEARFSRDRLILHTLTATGGKTFKIGAIISF